MGKTDITREEGDYNDRMKGNSEDFVVQLPYDEQEYNELMTRWTTTKANFARGKEFVYELRKDAPGNMIKLYERIKKDLGY